MYLICFLLLIFVAEPVQALAAEDYYELMQGTFEVGFTVRAFFWGVVTAAHVAFYFLVWRASYWFRLPFLFLVIPLLFIQISWSYFNSGNQKELATLFYSSGYCEEKAFVHRFSLIGE